MDPSQWKQELKVSPPSPPFSLLLKEEHYPSWCHSVFRGGCRFKRAYTIVTLPLQTERERERERGRGRGVRVSARPC